MGSILNSLTPTALRAEGEAGYRRLAPLRYQRALGYEWWRGRHDDKARAGARRQPVNLTQQDCRTLMVFLAFNSPSASIIAEDVADNWQAKIETAIADQDAERLDLTDLYQREILDNILSGTTFHLIGLKAGGQKYTTGSRKLEMGQEFERMLDLDDITIDPYSKMARYDARFIGYRYPVPLSEALEGVDGGQYGALPEDYADGQLPVPAEFMATPDEAREILTNLTPRESFSQNSEQVAQPMDHFAASGERLETTIMLWDYVIYDGDEIWIVTMAGNPRSDWPMQAGNDKFLSVWKWDGDKNGPITQLSLLPSPWSLLDMPIERMQRDLSEVAAMIANKIAAALVNTKTVNVFDPGSADLAIAIRNAKADSMLPGNPQGITSIKVGGLLPEMMPAAEFFDNKAQQQNGNLGLGSGTRDTDERTATAYNGQTVGVQGMMQFYRRRVEDWAQRNLKVRMHYVKSNPMLNRAVSLTLGQPPFQVSVPGRLTPESAPVDRFKYKVKAFSMAFVDPAVQADQLLKVLIEVYPALLAQAPSGLDVLGAMRMVSEQMNLPGLEGLLPNPMWQMQQQMMQQLGPGIDQNPSGNPGDVAPSGPGAARGTRVQRPPGNMQQGLGARQSAGSIQ